jgi:hypothetical protein
MGKKLVGAAFLFFVVSLAWGPSGWAQIVPSETETLRVVGVIAPKAPGTVSVVISLANARYISGITGRIVFDPNIITPVVTDAQNNLVSMQPVGRGTVLGDYLAASPQAGVVNFLLVTQIVSPVQRINPGSGPVLQLDFNVQTTLDTTICLRLEDDPVEQGPENSLSDTLGLSILPTRTPGSVQVGAGSTTGGCGPIDTTGGGGPGNDPPTINFISAQTVPQGSILSFTVTASDINGDNVTLSATTLPQNATFTTVTGDSLVSGTFRFTPSLSQVGNFTATFRAVDDSGVTATRSVSITVTEVQQDILFSSSVTGQSPTGAIPGKRPAFFPIDLTARAQVYGMQFDLKIDTGVIRVDSILTTERLQNFLIDVRPMPGQADRLRVLAFSLSGDSVRPATLPTIMHLALSVSPSAPPGKTDVVMDSGWESVNPRLASVPMATVSGEFFIDRFGDANLDTLINVGDVVTMVHYVLGRLFFSGRQFDAADLNQDTVVNIFDIVNTINVIFGNPLPPASPYVGPPATLALNARPFAFNPGEPIKLEAELPTDIAGVQVHISYDPNEVKLERPQRTPETGGLVLDVQDTTGRMSIVLYNMGSSANEVSSGRAILLDIPAIRLSGIGDTIPPKLTITRAFLSTGKGEGVPVVGIGANVPRQFELFQNYPNPFNPKTTIQFKVAAASGDGSSLPVKLEVFNILGQSVKTLLDERRTPGSYRVEWDGTDVSGNRVSSGIYLYRLSSEKFSVTKKMLLLK